MAVFLMENGVLSMGNKTPVTILQETLQRKGLNPHYELIYNGVGTVDPVFKYQVSAAGFTAIGDGKSKKEAKHDAAAAILKRMQEGTESSKSQERDIASPYSGAIKQNFVGMLDEICVNNKIPFPVFIPISEDGPPHARIFTMQCKLSTCTETAVARTKKQAKHMVSQQMIKRIADIMGDRFIPIAEKTMESEDFTLSASNLKAIENGCYRHDLSIPIADFHNVFYHKLEEFLVPKSFLDLPTEPDEYYENLENPKDFLNNIVQGLEGLSKTVPISKTALLESIHKLEKDCQMFFWVQEEELDDGVGEESNSFGDDDNDYFVDDVRHVLEEFDLGEDKEQLAETIISENLEYASEILESTNFEPLDDKHQSENELKVSLALVNPAFVYITVECPQGEWSFRGFGETELQAEKIAAIQALKFLRVMSIPSNTTNGEIDS